MSYLKWSIIIYDTDECRNVTIGKVILVVSTYFNERGDKKKTIDFVECKTGNTRNATKEKAEQFLKKYHWQN
jgi:hypothetical protein